MSNGRHRVPPRPKHMSRSKPGQCKFCGDPVIKHGKINKRASWHPQCALRWTIMNSPCDARRFVFVRDRGICKECGRNCAPDNGNPDLVARIIEQIMQPNPEMMKLGTPPVVLGTWELDHIVPLSQAAKRGNPPELWMLQNMMTLCPPCHVVKTKLDRLIYEQEGVSCSHIVTSKDALEALGALGFAKNITTEKDEQAPPTTLSLQGEKSLSEKIRAEYMKRVKPKTTGVT